jgi:quinol monooxygenase YgiN
MVTFAEKVYFQPQPIKGAMIMASMIIQLKVKDFAEWKKVFDSLAGFRKSSGQLSEQVFRDASDPNSLTTLTKWNSLENAQKFSRSPELKAAMATEKIGVAGPPSVYFLNEV